MRAATVVAAMRRGWVQAILPSMPRPAARQNLGIWVVLPEPVSPEMMVTGCCPMLSTMAALAAVMGKWVRSSKRGTPSQRRRLLASASFMRGARASSRRPKASSASFLRDRTNRSSSRRRAMASRCIIFLSSVLNAWICFRVSVMGVILCGKRLPAVWRPFLSLSKRNTSLFTGLCRPGGHPLPKRFPIVSLDPICYARKEINSHLQTHGDKMKTFLTGYGAIALLGLALVLLGGIDQTTKDALKVGTSPQDHRKAAPPVRQQGADR